MDTSTSPFGIDASPLATRLALRTGASVAGELLLRRTTTATYSDETLGARLNESGDAFLPLDVGSGVELVRLSSVVYFECPPGLPEVDSLRGIGAQSELVEIELVNGEHARGALLCLAPPNRRRLSDLLNASDPFLLLVDSTRTLYVNRDAITRVRSLGEPHAASS